MKIHALTQTQLGLQKPAAGNKETGGDFAQTLMDVMKEVNQSQLHGREMQNALMTNQPVEIHDVMIAMEQASIAMNLTLQVRNKLLEAYQEISRTQI
ncbi:MAG TPA: flagellar hook-basal body complex protein FliE [Fimbriimonadaceae bacterium]|nr:flagellar hook-basal body complex protein FliE [Fimbriimonadaceae bacterium]